MRLFRNNILRCLGLTKKRQRKRGEYYVHLMKSHMTSTFCLTLFKDEMVMTRSINAEIRRVHNILLKTPQRKTLLERPKRDLKNNKKTARGYVSTCSLYVKLACHRVKWRALAKRKWKIFGFSGKSKDFHDRPPSTGPKSKPSW
jgi:hypothetical protein